MHCTSGVQFWCVLASVGMLPAVYCRLESSALPYSRTGQKPVNETALQGVTYRPCWCFTLYQGTLQKTWRCDHNTECHSNCIMVHHLHEILDEWMHVMCVSERDRVGVRERKKAWGVDTISFFEYQVTKITIIQFEKIIQKVSNHINNLLQRLLSVSMWFMWKPAERVQTVSNISILCTRMAFQSQTVNLLSKLACALGHGGGAGSSPWCPSPQTERWKQVCLCGNAAVMLLDTQQAAVTLLGQLTQRPSLGTTEMEQLVMAYIWEC